MQTSKWSTRYILFTVQRDTCSVYSCWFLLKLLNKLEMEIITPLLIHTSRVYNRESYLPASWDTDDRQNVGSRFLWILPFFLSHLLDDFTETTALQDQPCYEANNRRISQNDMLTSGFLVPFAFNIFCLCAFQKGQKILSVRAAPLLTHFAPRHQNVVAAEHPDANFILPFKIWQPTS